MNSVFRSYACLFVLIFAPLVSIAGEQADKAIAGVKSLVTQGSIAPDTVIRLVAKQGNIANFLGRNHDLKNQWEEATGILIDAKTMPQKASIDYIKNNTDIDITVARNREYADLYHNQLIIDLTPYINQYGLELTRKGDNEFLMPYKQAYYAGIPVALPADGDLALLYIRKDLLENQEHQDEYFKQYDQVLRVPETWSEYQQQVEFFHRPDKGVFGSVEQRDEASAWMFWMPRYVAQAYPNQYLFDDNMVPLVASEAGVAATESYLATIPFSPAEILDHKSNYTYTLPIFMNGGGFSTIITLAGAKVFNLPHSKIKGKYTAVPMPGVVVDKKVNRRSTLIYGNNLVIPSSSNNRELAFLFAMWLTDPEISEIALSEKGGFSDPYRANHFQSVAIQDTYGAEVLKTALGDIDITVPAGTGLPGDKEYIAALNRQLYLASKGEKTAKQAMQDTAKEWDLITEAYGRAQQINYWLKMKALFPTVH